VFGTGWQFKQVVRNVEMVIPHLLEPDFSTIVFTMLLLYLFSNMYFVNKIQDNDFQRRTLFVVYHIMHMHIDEQPARDTNGNLRSSSSLFTKLCRTDILYARMLLDIMKESTPADQEARSKCIDNVMPERNFMVHPCDIDALEAESNELVYAFKTRAFRGMFSQIHELEAKLLIVSNGRKIIARDYKPTT
jgi:hypothetical protein